MCIVQFGDRRKERITESKRSGFKSSLCCLLAGDLESVLEPLSPL